MENAHLRLGLLEYVRITEKASNRGRFSWFIQTIGLFRSQRLHGIDRSRAPRRYECRCYRRNRQQRGHANQRHRIPSLHAEQQAAYG
jgi:hypothetical protein